MLCLPVIIPYVQLTRDGLLFLVYDCYVRRLGRKKTPLYKSGFLLAYTSHSLHSLIGVRCIYIDFYQHYSSVFLVTNGLLIWGGYMSTLLSDLPALEDELGWNNDFNHLLNRIQQCPTPHVIGIHGDWGSGKTSFMRQLQYELGGEMPKDGSVSERDPLAKAKKKDIQKTIVTIWFDAWQYQNEAVPIVALLQEMRRQMETMPALKAKFGKLGEIALRATLNSLGDMGKLIGLEGLPSADKIEKTGQDWEARNYAQAMQIDSIKGQLQLAMKSLLPGNAKNVKNARIVIFIDDLDRCNPKAAIRLLEGLKIYLSLPNCVFVLGMNERILVDVIHEEVSLGNKLEEGEKRRRASHYLEKICSDIFRLAVPRNSAELLVSWIEKDEHKKALSEALKGVTCLPPNPRKLKALSNQWGRFAKCVTFPDQAEERKIWSVRVLIAAYVHQFHRELWERWSFQPEFGGELISWCLGERSTSGEGTSITSPLWADGLKLTALISSRDEVTSAPQWQSSFPNPGDIDIFWIDNLFRKYEGYLQPKDFEPLLKVCK